MDKVSTEIFNRLYDLHDCHDEDPKFMICAEAADQIKKLSDRLAELTTAPEKLEPSGALIKLLRDPAPCDFCEYEDGCNHASCALMQKAAAALENLNRRATTENPLTMTFPCQIGDKIYEAENGLVTSYHVTGFVLGKTEFEDYDDVSERHGWQIEYGKLGIDCECPITEIGKSLFFTKEAAENAPAARKPEGPVS